MLSELTLRGQYVLDIVLSSQVEPPFFSHVGNLIFEISHGHVVKDDSDALLTVAQQVDHDFAEMVVPGAFLVDVFPVCKS